MWKVILWGLGKMHRLDFTAKSLPNVVPFHRSILIKYKWYHLRFFPANKSPIVFICICLWNIHVNADTLTQTNMTYHPGFHFPSCCVSPSRFLSLSLSHKGAHCAWQNFNLVEIESRCGSAFSSLASLFPGPVSVCGACSSCLTSSSHVIQGF